MTSRMTFRPIIDGAPAWQKQLRDSYEGQPAPPVPSGLSRYRVRPVSRATAQQVILKYEWLGTLPAASHFFGIFAPGDDGLDYVAGVTAVADRGTGTAGSHTAKQYGIARDELATLIRGACVHWAPPGANSKLVSWTTRLLRNVSPRSRVIVAYADSDAGEVGTIYQACGWTYIGKGASVFEYVSPSGAVFNQRLLGNRGGNSRGISPPKGRRRYAKGERALLDAGWRKQKSNPKGRYVLVLDKHDDALVARVRSMALSYPKRSRGGGE